MKKRSVVRVFVGIALISVAFTGCTKTKSKVCDLSAGSDTNVIRVGEVGSMTGSEATFGVSTHEGIQLALCQANAAGGVKGKKFVLYSLDDQSKQDEAAAAMTKLITQSKVDAILGEVASGISKVMAPIAQANKVPMITPSSTNPDVTKIGDYIFRVCFIDPFQGYVMAKFAKENLKAKKVAILQDHGSDYSVGLAKFFIETFTKDGGEIVLNQSYNKNDVDFKSQLTAIRAKAPDAIYIPGYYTHVGLIARQARELGVTIPLMGGDGWDSPELKSIGGAALNNSYFSNHYSAEDKSPAVQTFLKEYKETFGKTPDGLAAMGYDAARVLADAMNRAKSLSNTDVRDAIAATVKFEGVTGKITIDKERNAVKPAVVLRVDNGEFKYQSTIHP
ncbi:ABC transporter substrate-binding protein [bacterium]|jgi:branched-chain amino acid transport system substrate-binding protein|nr:ABC transporter substrate-binding protein [bacterium]